MQVWNVLHVTLWNTGRKNRQTFTAWAPSHNLSGCIFATKACIDNRKKLVKQQFLHMSPAVCELWPISGLDGFTSLGHPSKFQWVSRLGFVTAAMTLDVTAGMTAKRCTMFGCLLAATVCIHFRGLLSPNEILQGAKFTLRPSLAFSYIGSVTARHSSSWRQPNLAALSRERHLYSAGRPSRWASAHILVFFYCFVQLR